MYPEQRWNELRQTAMLFSVRLCRSATYRSKILHEGGEMIRFLKCGGFSLIVLWALLVVPAHAVAQAKAPAIAPTETSCNLSAPDIYANASPAVVLIRTRSINPYKLTDRVESALGSGFVFDKSGLILTNSHVVFGAQLISVAFNDGRTVAAEIVGLDPIFDLAVLHIAVPTDTVLPALTLENSSPVRVGDDVIAIGNPLGLNQTLTRGVVSALNRVLPETPFSTSRPMIQTDTSINPGNSGGPLIDRCGRVVGINTSIIPGARGIGFAVPSELILEVLPSLLKNGGVVRKDIAPPAGAGPDDRSCRTGKPGREGKNQRRSI